MNKTIVFYYSRTGSNRYLAEKIAQRLDCEIEAIRPRVSLFLLVLLFSLTKFSFGIRKTRHNPGDFDRVILIGPHYFGHLASPIRDFIKKFNRDLRNLHYATCCGSSDQNKDDQFGYASIFSKLKTWMGDTSLHCEAFPIHLVVPPEKLDDDKAIMETRLSDENFHGEIEERLEGFISKVMAEGKKVMA